MTLSKRSFLAGMLCALALLAGAQEAQAPAAAAIPTPAQLDQAIEDFARQIPAGITADRYAAIAVQMPADEAEYQALNKHALLVVAALTKDASELPLQRVYLEHGDGATQFSPLALVRREVPADSAAGKLMGTHRVDAYYLIPLSAWRQPGTLLADFAAHRQEFILGKFPQEIKEEFIRSDATPEPTAGREVAMSAVGAILARTAPAPMQGAGPRVRLSSEAAQKRLLREVEPKYPQEAKTRFMQETKARLIQRTVLLHVLIGADGTVQEVHPISGHALLVPAAVEAVSQWRYRPYLLKGQPVAVESQAVVNFTLWVR